jgi:rod shape determining protein RodA
MGLLIFIGIMMILSCTFSQQSREGDDPLFYTKKQLLAFIIGAMGLAVFAYIDYSHLKNLAVPLYIISIFFLFIVIYKGFTILGAQRWITFGPVSFQPSEIAKLTVLLTLGSYLEGKRGEIKGITNLIAPLLILGLPFVLIFKQPDLGTAIILFFIFAGMLIWAEASNMLLILLITPILSIFLRQYIYIWIIYLVGLALYMKNSRIRLLDLASVMIGNIGIGYAVSSFWGMLKEYQRQRLLAFLNPDFDPLGIGYHSLQAKIAVGGGGILGKGFMHGTQTQLSFIPQQFTDFIFSAIGEELGFIGAIIIIVLFTIIIYRAIVIANEARDFYGSIIAAGIAAMIGFQMFTNISMTLGLMPVVGVPLPFVSFGGTALIMDMCAIGILQSISMRRRKLLF